MALKGKEVCNLVQQQNRLEERQSLLKVHHPNQLGASIQEEARHKAVILPIQVEVIHILDSLQAEVGNLHLDNQVEVNKVQFMFLLVAG